ncbi:MAG: HipA domain-containing protein [Eggerthellaceae bacterium]|nr:HipA domain-containing protein [Eggerthellaceae bacterium]
MDYSNYPRTDVYYGGTERKVGILIAGREHIVKFRKRDEFRIRNNHISEYLGSRVFNMLGMQAQETFLGTFQEEQVVVCRSFLEPSDQFVPFNEVGESTLEQDKEQYQYDYQDIMRMLRDNSKLTDVQETIASFWDMYMIDALLGNFDRHGANWGFVKRNNTYELAPVFDNGSCLYPNMTDDSEARAIIASPAETDRRVYQFPTSQVKLHGRKSSYYDVIASLEFNDANDALERIAPRVQKNLGGIHDLVESADFASGALKLFYHHMLDERYRKIINAPYRALTGGDHEE